MIKLILVVIGGLAVGYWAVNLFMSTHGDEPEAPLPPLPDDARHADGDYLRDRSAADARAPEADPFDRSARDAIALNPAPRRPWHQVLDVPKAADATEISYAYRRALAQYDPRQLETLAPELRALALQRRQDIEAAYLEALRNLRR